MEKGGELKPFEFEAGELRPGQIEIAVEFCGICHSDLSMIDGEWGNSKYPLVPGHEVVGKIVAIGPDVPATIKEGQRVGLGWFSESCMACDQCMGGDHNLCATAEQTIVSRHGGFAERVRCHWGWATPLPEGIDFKKAGPLFCGGITVFNPIVQCGVKPTDRVGVIGLGGLGHLALQFLDKWGCEVTAFSSNASKTDELLKLGADEIVNSRDAAQLGKVAGKFDFILSTVNVPLDWNAYLGALAPRGRLHTVGAVLEPIPVPAFSLIMAQRSLSGSPMGSPATTREMVNFCARHGIAPVTEHYPMSQANDALEHLRAGKARYRIVLEADF
jgi:alcohol/geraniol dehydrogenase (NADP+)